MIKAAMKLHSMYVRNIKIEVGFSVTGKYPTLKTNCHFLKRNV